PGSSGCTVPPVSSSGGVSSQAAKPMTQASESSSESNTIQNFFILLSSPINLQELFPPKRKKRAFGRRPALHCSISDRWHKTFRTREIRDTKCPSVSRVTF